MVIDMRGSQNGLKAGIVEAGHQKPETSAAIALSWGCIIGTLLPFVVFFSVLAWRLAWAL